MNVSLTAAAALLAGLLVDPDSTSAAQLLAFAALAAGAGAVVNLALISSRFGPLETLIEDMEKVDLSSPGANLPDSIDGRGETEEVERLELAFLRMMRRLEAERHRASSAALMAQERERARIARDLHDEVNQSLTGLLLRLEALRDDAPPGLTDRLEETKALANQAMEELLTLARQLRPTALDDLGLEAAVAGLVEQSAEATDARAEISVESGTAASRDGGSSVDDASAAEQDAPRLNDLPSEVQLVLYRVAQEALANAIRHSGAETIRVTLAPRAPDGAELTVADDGRGFAFDEAGSGLGLEGMRERALLVGGRLDVQSGPGRGTTVHLSV